MIPLVRMASECFSDLEAKAKAAGNEVSTAGLPAMFTLKPASPAALTAARSRLKAIDARLLEYDAAIRKSASKLTAAVESSDSPPQVKAIVMASVRESGTDLVKRCRESVAHQRRLVAYTEKIVSFIEPRLKKLSPKSAQTVFTTRADQAAFEKLIKQFDAYEEESTLTLRRIHQRADQAKQQLLVALTQTSPQ
jgi:TRAP-type mannitol/chloroaromatic compound transport system substrate-binding protein